MAAETVQDILEETNQVIEDTLDLMEQKVSWATRNPKLLVFAAALSGFAVGGALGYVIAKKKSASRSEAYIKEQVNEIRAHYAVTREKPDLKTLAEPKPVTHDASKIASEIITREGYTSYEKVEPASAPEEPSITVRDLAEPTTGTNVEVLVDEEERRRNIFALSMESDDPETYWDWAEETTRREEKPNDPFVVTQQEFNENEDDLNTVSLMYYDGDQVLVDEDSKPIDNDDEIVGAENLLRFGHASGDPNVVYVRNNRLEIMCEITRNDGYYSQAIHGFRHSEDPRIMRRFRQADE